MFPIRFRLNAALRAAIPLVALLALSFGVTSTAHALFLLKVDEGNGHYSWLVFDDEGNLKSIHYYGPGNEHFRSEFFDGDPNPEGDGTGGTVNQDVIDAALDMAKKFGTPYFVAPDGWSHLLNHSSALNNKGPNVTDPWNDHSFYDDGYGGGGGGGSFDPNVPLGEQLPSQPGTSDDDDDEGVRRPDPADAYDFDPDVIDPSPEGEYDAYLRTLSGR